MKPIISDEILRDVWILNVETGRWRRGPEMPEPMTATCFITFFDDCPIFFYCQ